jgi:hypothetical protein
MINSDEQSIKRAMGNDLFRKVIASILLAQAEIIRTSGLPVGGGFISFRRNKIFWSLTGDKISTKGLQSFLSRTDLEQIKESAILSLKRGQKIDGKDLRRLKIVSGRNQFIEIRLSNEKYPKYVPPIKGPTGSQELSQEVVTELENNKKEIEKRKGVGITKWTLNMLISIRTFILSFFKKE